MSITVTAVGDMSSKPRVLVTVTASPVFTAPVSVYRVHADGSQWLVIAETRPQVIGGSWVGFDYHAPFNQAVTYTASSGGFTASSSAVTLVNAKTCWLVHQSTPALSVGADRVMVMADPVLPIAPARFDILGSASPIHLVSAPRALETGAITVACDKPGSLAAVKALLADGGAILINTPWTTQDIGWLWVQPLTATVQNPATGSQWYGSRRVLIPFEGTSQPDTDVTPIWTAAMLLATGWTAAVAVTKYATAAGMKTDSRL